MKCVVCGEEAEFILCGCSFCEKHFYEANFHQKIICLDPKCWDKKQKEKREQELKEQKMREKILEDERRKVWDVEKFDVRHWRLAVAGLISDYELKDLLGIKRKEWAEWGGHADEELLKKIQELSEEEWRSS